MTTRPRADSRDKQQVKRYARSVIDEPFLNRVSQGGPCRDATTTGKTFTKQPSLGSLIFGLIRLRSSTFGSTPQCRSRDVSGIRRTIIQTPENRKAGGSTPPLAAATRVR